jgi:hypothetical protein
MQDPLGVGEHKITHALYNEHVYTIRYVRPIRLPRGNTPKLTLQKGALPASGSFPALISSLCTVCIGSLVYVKLFVIRCKSLLIGYPSW